MNVDGTPYRTIWPLGDGGAVEINDQTQLSHQFVRVLETRNPEMKENLSAVVGWMLKV